MITGFLLSPTPSLKRYAAPLMLISAVFNSKESSLFQQSQPMSIYLYKLKFKVTKLKASMIRVFKSNQVSSKIFESLYDLYSPKILTQNK